MSWPKWTVSVRGQAQTRHRGRNANGVNPQPMWTPHELSLSPELRPRALPHGSGLGFRVRRQLPLASTSLRLYRPFVARVALFDPCYMNTLRPSDAARARHVLETLGDTVELIDGRCCGQPAFNSGFHDEARTVGRELLRAGREFDIVVTPSGSCTSMVQHYLPSLFGDPKTPGRAANAAAIAHRFHEFSAYVAAHPALDKMVFKLEGTVAYHDSCHARRELALTSTVASLLARVQGLEVRRLSYEAECCGFGGSFSLKLPEISVAMMTSKLDDAVQTGARVLVSTDFSCLSHLEAGARGLGIELETWTIAELLSRALE